MKTTFTMPTELWNNLYECRTLEEMQTLADLYVAEKQLNAEYKRAAKAGSDNATELHVRMMKARLAYLYAVQGVAY